jgi:ABC-type lipoprotein export system ATPase subunit
MIKVSHLIYSYSPQNIIRFPDFEMPKGGSMLLLGNSGSGKTTLLHLLGGILRSQFGKIMIDGEDITSLSETVLDEFRAKYFGFVFQKNHLITALNVRNNLLMAPFLAGLKQGNMRVEEVLKTLSLQDKQNARISQLSQGQAQRLAIARAVLNKPSIILADEPTSALDDVSCDQVINLLLQVSAESNSSLIVATHDQRLKSRIKTCIQL